MNKQTIVLNLVIFLKSEMLDDIECISIKYLSYTIKDVPFVFKKFKQGYYPFGYHGIFLGKHKIDIGFILGLIDAKRYKFLDRKLKKYASDELMFYCQVRQNTNLIKRLILECDIDPFPDWVIRNHNIDSDFDEAVFIRQSKDFI